MKIVLASDNTGKIKEFREIVANLKVTFIAQKDLKIQPAVEDATTFVENALIKARHGALHSGLPAIADDSGLVVDALKGVPGVHSARYAGVPSDTAKNNAKLLKAMETIPPGKRSARYYSIIAFMTDPNDPAPIICQGIWEGEIALAPAGTNGFGYDPIFFVPSLNCTAAELSPVAKNVISHRGKALKAFSDAFENYYRQQRSI